MEYTGIMAKITMCVVIFNDFMNLILSFMSLSSVSFCMIRITKDSNIHSNFDHNWRCTKRFHTENLVKIINYIYFQALHNYTFLIRII